MIIHHEKISLAGIPLFTKIGISTPTDQILPLPADACYTYIIDGDEQSFSKQENITATPGKVILSLCGLTMGKMLSEQPKGAVDSVIVHFNPELLKYAFEGTKPQYWEELDTPVTQYVVQSVANSLVKNYFEGIIQLFRNKEALTDFLLKVKLKEIILLLLQTENSNNIRRIIRSLFSERTFSFKEMVDAHIFKPVTIENLAMLTNCSLSTFKRKFKEIYNAAPGEFITGQRLEKVAQLLKVSDLSVSAVGYECGFENPEHLSRIFKKKYGIPPSKYRLDFRVR